MFLSKSGQHQERNVPPMFWVWSSKGLGVDRSNMTHSIGHTSFQAYIRYVLSRQLQGKLRKFNRKFPQSVPPSTATICTRVVKFRATGPVSDQKITGRIRIRQKLQDIGVRIEAPKKSLRFSALQCGKLRSTVHVATRLLVTIPQNEMFYAIFCLQTVR